MFNAAFQELVKVLSINNDNVLKRRKKATVEAAIITIYRLYAGTWRICINANYLFHLGK